MLLLQFALALQTYKPTCIKTLFQSKNFKLFCDNCSSQRLLEQNLQSTTQQTQLYR